MCLCAIMWANIRDIYYGASLSDNEFIGFRDRKFDEALRDRSKIGNLKQVNRAECLDLFKEYNNIKDKRVY